MIEKSETSAVPIELTPQELRIKQLWEENKNLKELYGMALREIEILKNIKRELIEYIEAGIL